MMSGMKLNLRELTLTAVDTPAMVRFYDTLFGSALQPVAAFGTTLYRGQLHGLPLLICPNDIAGVDAAQNRHQFTYETPDLAKVIETVLAAGGVVREQADATATVLDPDGNTIVFTEV
jgi:predicted enzyme related to lactoylglutathione lyase